MEISDDDPRIITLCNMLWDGRLHTSKFNIFDPTGRRKAAKWLLRELDLTQLAHAAQSNNGRGK